MSSLINVIFVPSGFIALLIVAAGVAFFIFKQQKTAVYMIVIASSIYTVFGCSLTVMWLMGSLESEFAQDRETALTVIPDTVVVLAGYALADVHRPITGRVNSASGFRLLEAARLFKRTGGTTVIITGDGETPAVMKDMLIQLGVPRTNIVTEHESSNTYASAVHQRDRLAGKKFYLVTSAGHMPRAMRVFRKQGLSAIPAPTHFLSPVSLRDSSIVPSGRNLAISDLAVHEYLGLIWYRLLGRI